jgi:hypothetical protein
MNKLVPWFTSTIVSYAGWWLGAKLGIMTAFMLSMVGFGVGMWYGRKWLAEHL